MKDKKRSRVKKTVLLVEALDWCVLAVSLLACMLQFKRGNILGYIYGTIVSESMLPEYEVGSSVIVSLRDKELEVGDVAVYLKNNNSIIHRVIDTRGSGYVFKGDNNQLADGLVPKGDVVGTVVYHTNFASGLYVKYGTGLIQVISIVGFLIYAAYTVMLMLRYHREDDKEEQEQKEKEKDSIENVTKYVNEGADEESVEHGNEKEEHLEK